MLHKFSKIYPKFGPNFLLIVSFAYELLYFKKGNKKMALNEHRERNLFPSGYFKFDISKNQREYLDVISFGRESSNIFNLPKQLRNELKVLNLDFTLLDNILNIFNFVKTETQKKPKQIKDCMNSFIQDEDLFLIFFDYISRFAQNMPLR